MFKARKSDYFAIIFAILLTPLLVQRRNDIELIPIASQMQLYSSSYFSTVKAPITIAVINQEINNEFYEVPHILFPGFEKSTEESSVDAVAFTGLQKELVYSQRFSGLKYRSPYIKQNRLFSKNSPTSEEQESTWKDSLYKIFVDTGAKGPIKAISQPLSFFRERPLPIVGITEDFEVFMLNKDLKPLWVNNKLMDVFKKYIEAYNISKVTNYKVVSESYNLKVFVSVIGVNNESDAFVFTSSLNYSTGATLWEQASLIKSDIWSQDVELIKPLQVALRKADEAEDQVQKNPYQVLSSLLLIEKKLGVLMQHGQVGVLYSVGTYVVLKTKQFIQILNTITGREEASFAVRPAVQVVPSSQGLELQYLSDFVISSQQGLKKNQRFDVICQSLTWDKEGKLLSSLKFVAPLSEMSDFVELQMYNAELSKLRPAKSNLLQPITFITNNKHVAVYLAPNGVIYAIDAVSGKRLWRQVVSDFQPTTINAHLSFQVLDNQSNSGIVILSLGNQIHIYNSDNGRDMGVFTLEGVKLYDTKDAFYDDDQARVGCQILVDRLHPYSSKKSIFVIRGRFMDVLGTSNKSITLGNFWERTSLTLLITFIIALFLRVVFVVVEKID